MINFISREPRFLNGSDNVRDVTHATILVFPLGEAVIVRDGR